MTVADSTVEIEVRVPDLRQHASLRWMEGIAIAGAKINGDAEMTTLKQTVANLTMNDKVLESLVGITEAL